MVHPGGTMQIKTNKDMPMDISIMLNRADIDKLIGQLQRLKSNPEEHIDIFCTDFENDPAIANIEISYFEERAANYSMDGE
jgi:hypothetical protein